MNIRNYTSTVPMISSITKIEYRLAQAGASYITKHYEDDKPSGMIFQININGSPRIFKLPAKTDKVYKYLRLQRKKPPTKVQEQAIRRQADQTAWKILCDWIDIQISLIELEQAEFGEVFFPYLFDVGTNITMWELAKSKNFELLEKNPK